MQATQNNCIGKTASQKVKRVPSPQREQVNKEVKLAVQNSIYIISLFTFYDIEMLANSRWHALQIKLGSYTYTG